VPGSASPISLAAGLFPLLSRVDLRIPYYTLSLLWAYLLGLPPTSFSVYKRSTGEEATWTGFMTTTLHLGFYAMMVVWHVAEGALAPPASKPDLWVVINVGIGAAGFGVCYLWCLWSLVVERGFEDKAVEKKKSL